MNRKPDLDLSNKPIAARAMSLMLRHHDGVRRKYNDEPYAWHPIRVAAHVMEWGFIKDEAIAIALLHDCLEDPNVVGKMLHIRDITDGVGSTLVARGVEALTKRKRGNRAKTLNHYNQQLQMASDTVKAIKVADIHDNLGDLYHMLHDNPAFASQYVEEKARQVAAINSTLMPAHRSVTVAGDTIIRIARNKVGLHLIELGEAEQTRREEIAADEAALVRSIETQATRDALASYALF